MSAAGCWKQRALRESSIPIPPQPTATTCVAAVAFQNSYVKFHLFLGCTKSGCDGALFGLCVCMCVCLYIGLHSLLLLSSSPDRLQVWLLLSQKCFRSCSTLANRASSSSLAASRRSRRSGVGSPSLLSWQTRTITITLYPTRHLSGSTRSHKRAPRTCHLIPIQFPLFHRWHGDDQVRALPVWHHRREPALPLSAGLSLHRSAE